jgi:hypothetical protein
MADPYLSGIPESLKSGIFKGKYENILKLNSECVIHALIYYIEE